MHERTHTHTHTHNDCSKNWVLILVEVEILWEEDGFQSGFKKMAGLSSVCQWHHKQDQYVWQKYQTHDEPAFLCSSLVQSKPRWLHPEEYRFKAKKYFCINEDRTTKQSPQMKIFAHFFFFFRPTHVFSSVPLLGTLKILCPPSS